MLALNQNESARKIRRIAVATAVLALACIALPSFARSAEADVTPPTLAALTLPVQVPTGAFSPTVTVSARITDDLSGVAASDAQTACAAGPPRMLTYVALRSPSDAVFAGRFDPTGGDAYESVVQLPRFAPPGTWTVEFLSLIDCAGNTRDLRRADLVAAGFPSTFTVRGEGDLTPPRLRALTLDPASVDNTSPAVITVTATITDDLSGVASNDRATTCGSAGSVSTVKFQSPSGDHTLGNVFRHVSGDTYEASFPVPRYSEAGTWTALVTLVDCVNNFDHLHGDRLHIPHVSSTLEISGSTDTTPPFPRRLSITPTTVRTGTTGADVVLRATLDDDLSGVLTAGGPTGCDAVPSVAVVTSPSGAPLLGGFVQLSDRDFSATVSLPASAAPGTWTVRLELADCAGNYRRLDPSDLTALGLPSSFQVVAGYVFGGFMAPLHPTELAHRKPGSAMAVKFRLDGAQGVGIFEASYPRVQSIDCVTREPLGDAMPLGPTQWVFQELTGGLYHYKWKSNPEWRDVCRRLILGFDDGSRYSADVLFK